MTYFLMILFIFFILVFPLLRLKWLKHDARWRAFLSHVPKNDSKKRPLLIVLHGAGGNYYRISKFAKYTRLNAFADKNNFVVIYPVALKKNWNDSSREGTQEVQDIDDVGYIEALIKYCQRHYKINSVFIAGMSNGGAMAYRLSCELSTQITGIATIASFMPRVLATHCNPSQPIPVLLMNGTEDPLIPMHGGDLQFRKKTLGKILATDEVIKFWSTINACQHQQSIDITPTVDDTYVQHNIYRDKNNDKQIEQYIIFGGGHTWSGSRQYLPKAWVGCASQAIDASEILCQFIQQHQQ